MSLFGALSSGVSGLTSQSSAMGAISDNITNVSTIGYKQTTVNFQSLVTKQTSSTFYSAGGVQSKPRQDTGVQGLLQASTSSTDIAISGNGFFVVNEAASPSVDDQFLYTRSGSFFQDNEGFLRNTSGFYLQGWPTTASGVVKPANAALTVANQNIVSTDYLSTVNLNRVGGTASSTSTIGIGANLPSNDSVGTEHKTDVQFFDSLGNANTMSVVYTRSSAENEWSMTIEPPQGTTNITMEDSILNPKVYRSIGQLEFNKTDSTGATRRPADGASMTISEGGVTKTYVFDSNSSVVNATAQVSTVTIAQTSTVTQSDSITITGTIETDDVFSAVIDGTTYSYTAVAADTTTTVATGLAAVIGTAGGSLASAVGAVNVVTLIGATAGTTYTTSSSVTNRSNDTTQTATLTTTTTAAGGIAEVRNVAITGTVETDDIFTVTVDTTGMTNTGGSVAYAYTALAGDTASSVVTALVGLINAGAVATAMTASSSGANLILTADTVNEAFGGAMAAATTNRSADNTQASADAQVTHLDVDDGETVSVTIDGATTAGSTTVTYTYASDTLATAAASLAAAINADTTINMDVFASATLGVLSVTSRNAGTAFTISATEGASDANGDMTITSATTTANAGTLNTYQVDISNSSTLAGDVAALLSSIRANNSNFDTTNNRASTSAGSSTTVLFEDDGLSSMTIDPTGLKDSSGAAITTQVKSFTVDKRDTLYTDATQIKFTAVPAAGDKLVINGITYTFTTGEAESSAGADTAIYRDGPLDRVLADLEAAIEANDPDFSGDSVIVRASDSPSNNTLVLSSLTNGEDFTVITTNMTTPPTEPDGSSTVGASIYTATNTITVGTEPAISFSSDGLPNGFNIAELDIRNFANGAANMDDDSSNAKQITMDFGTLTEANGMTQFGASFTPVFINQNGSRFGTFAGVSISADGLVTALFDNGETRPIYKLPMATFVNVNGLESRTGNTWNATEASGDYTLRVADNGPAGQTVQGTLEASTVDIGEEFTDMIVVQRAYSASAKIISTADQMLEELMRVKR
jgi:flagellar hook protein FlgE